MATHPTTEYLDAISGAPSLALPLDSDEAEFLQIRTGLQLAGMTATEADTEAQAIQTRRDRIRLAAVLARRLGRATVHELARVDAASPSTNPPAESVPAESSEAA